MNCYEQHNNIWVEHLTTHLMLSANPTHYTGRRGARKKIKQRSKYQVNKQGKQQYLLRAVHALKGEGGGQKNSIPHRHTVNLLSNLLP